MDRTERQLLEQRRDAMVRYIRNVLPESGDERMKLTTLCEELSSSDWAKIGVIVGILWFKFDRLISAVERKK